MILRGARSGDHGRIRGDMVVGGSNFPLVCENQASCLNREWLGRSSDAGGY